jgi:hypothetical protein
MPIYFLTKLISRLIAYWSQPEIRFQGKGKNGKLIYVHALSCVVWLYEREEKTRKREGREKRKRKRSEENRNRERERKL